ncbi:MAG TPA: hypothetical protein VFQ87_03130 [Bradyrhizobium sp.]|jgi:hypothetical protein|nr:hypothetical protein [Bradyrhizobium sp.]
MNAAYRKRLAREAALLDAYGRAAPASTPKRKKRKPSKPKKRGKLRGKAKAAFLRRMAKGRRKTTTTARPRKGRKLTGRAKAAFLRRMASGRKGWRVPSKAQVSRARHRKGVKKHLRAITSIGRRQMVAGLVRLNPRTGRITMTKVANPRRKKHHHRGRRVKNPSFRGVLGPIKASIAPMMLGGLSGLGAGYMDAKLLGDKPTISILAKIGLAIIGAGFIGRRHPMAAAGWAGGLVGSTGYKFGAKWGGGMVALSPSSALKGIADMAAENPEMAATIAGLGDVVDANGGELGDGSDEYNDALGDDEDMSDLVEAEAA